MPDVAYLKLLILNEMHKPPYAGHPGYQKIITDPQEAIILAQIKGIFRVLSI